MKPKNPANVFLAAALSVLAVGSAAGYVAVIAPTYDTENRIPPPGTVISAAASEPVTEIHAPAETAPAEEEPQTVQTLLVEDPPEPAPPETDPPSPEMDAPLTGAEPAETTLEEWFALVEARTKRAVPETEPAVVPLVPDEVSPPDAVPAREGPEDPYWLRNTYEHEETEEYVLNTSTKKIHKPDCNDVSKIKPENYSTTDAPEDYLDDGYTNCGHCGGCG